MTGINCKCSCQKNEHECNDDALTTDGLSTAVFVLGPEKGLKMVERLPAIEVVVIDDKRMMHVSEGLVPPEP